MSEENSYIFYTFFKNLQEMKEKPPWCLFEIYHMYGRKYVHEVLVNRLGGLSLPRKSVVRLTDRPDMTLDVYWERKTTMQQMMIASYICMDGTPPTQNIMKW